MSLIFPLLTAAVLLLLYKWYSANNSYFEKKNIPCEKSLPLLGGLFKALVGIKSLPDYVRDLYMENKHHKVFGIYNFLRPAILLNDPELIKQIVVKDFEHFADHYQVIDEIMHPIMGKSLISLKGDQWRDMRATLSPMFTGNKMRQMFELISECAQQMSQHFLNESEQKSDKLIYEMKGLFSRFANDVIATCAFGIKVDSFEHKNNEFFVKGQLFTEFKSLAKGIKFIGYKIFPKLLRKLKVELFDKEATKYFQNIILETVQTRTEKNIVRPDLLNLLIRAKSGMLRRTDEKEVDGFATVEEHKLEKSKIKEQLTDDELVAQCLIFFFAGFDTVSTLLSFASYELTINPDIQEKLYEQIKQTHDNLNGSPLSYDALQGIKYLDMVISEALRKWPPLAIQDRQCTKKYKFNDGKGLEFTIGEDMHIFMPIIGLHYDPKYYPNPERFDPERFSDENKHNIIAGTYLPFGIGPRNCVGSRFALLEAKAVLYHLLLNFKFEITAKTQIPLKYSKIEVSSAEKGIWLEMRKRV